MKRINEAEAAEILKSKDNILILTHRSPDGDTLGCAFALRRVLSGMGKTVMVDCSDDIPKKYSYTLPNISFSFPSLPPTFILVNKSIISPNILLSSSGLE